MVRTAQFFCPPELMDTNEPEGIDVVPNTECPEQSMDASARTPQVYESLGLMDTNGIPGGAAWP